MPMTPQEQRAELQEWADEDWLITLVAKNLPQSERREIAQESWRRLADVEPARIKDQARFRSYAATVVGTVTLDITLGKRRRIKDLKYVQPTDPVMTKAGVVTEAENDKCERENQVHWLYKEIHSLPRRRRQIVELMKLEGLTAQQTALRLGLKANTVYSEVKKAIAYLMCRSGNPVRNSRPRRDQS